MQKYFIHIAALLIKIVRCLLNKKLVYMTIIFNYAEIRWCNNANYFNSFLITLMSPISSVNQL